MFPSSFSSFKSISRIALASLVMTFIQFVPTSSWVTSPAHAWENNKQYKETQKASPAPAGTFAAGAGGDGWGISVYNGKVYNIYHNSGGKLTLDCHNRADGRPCWNLASASAAAGWTDVSYQIQNNLNTGTNTPNTLLPAYGPGQWIDPTNGMLYAYTVNSNGSTLTPGIVQVDTSKIDPTHLLNGASRFYPLASNTVSCSNSVGSNCLTPTVQLNRKIFSVNFVTSSASSGTSLDANKVMCFDADTVAACSGSPITLPDAVSGTKYNVSQVGTFGDNLLIPLSSSSGSAKLECLSSITLTACAGWTAPIDSTYSGNGGAFPMLSATGVTTGVCIPDSTISCYNMSGAKITTPTGLTTVLPNKSGSRNGTSVTVGTRVFVPTTSDNMIHCIDWAVSGLVCSAVAPGAFPFNAATAGASSVYTVGTDSNDPTCIWLNSDKGTGTYTVPGSNPAITINGVGQIQSFDAYSGKACGSSGVRVLLQNFLAPGTACAPASYVSIQLSTPSNPGFTTGFSGTVSFLNVAGTQLKDSTGVNVADATISDTGLVNLPTNINNLATGVVPTIQIALLHSGTPYNNDIAVEFTWLSTNDPACTPAGYSEAPFNISFDLNGPVGATILVETVTQGAALSTAVIQTDASWNGSAGVTSGIPATLTPSPGGGWTGVFTGWATSPNGGSPISASNSAAIIPTANTTYYAQWSLPAFTVVFDSNGGNSLSPNSESITVGDDLGGGNLNVAGALPQPSWINSTKGFTGWYTAVDGGSLVTEATIPGASIGETVTYYAHWESALVVTTNEATSITQTSATINGSIAAADPTEAFFCEDESIFTSDTVTRNPLSCNNANLISLIVTSSPTTYSYNLTGLTAGTTYWFMQVGTQSGNVIPGAVLTFTTLSNVISPPPPPPPPPPPALLTPSIYWPTPSSETGPYNLTSSQLNATCSVPGSVLTYSPSLGNTLLPGTHTLYVTCVPPAGSGYGPQSTSVLFTVLKPVGTLTWSTPSTVTGPYSLTSSQLNATCSVPGSVLTYSPSLGITLQPGNYRLAVTCVPPAGSSFDPLTTSVFFTVNKPVGTLTWATPAPMEGPATLSSTQLNAVCSIPGSTITYVPSLGSVRSVGSRTLEATCTPPAGSAFDPLHTTVVLIVTEKARKVPPVVTIDPPVNPIAKIISGNSSTISWERSPNGLAYFVTIDGAKVCTTYFLSCTVKKLVGPNSDIKIYATKRLLTSTYVVPTIIKGDKPQVIGIIYFDTAKFNIKGDQQSEIVRVATELQKLGYKDVVIGGHTDSNTYDNETLSNNRAKSTRDALAKLVPGLNFDLYYSGATQPMASNSTMSGQAKNRRAEISVW